MKGASGMMRKEKPAKQMRTGNRADGKGRQRELPQPPKQKLWCRVCWCVEGEARVCVCVCARARARVHACACLHACVLHTCMHAIVYVCKVLMDRWMDGWMDGWMDICLYTAELRQVAGRARAMAPPTEGYIGNVACCCGRNGRNGRNGVVGVCRGCGRG